MKYSFHPEAEAELNHAIDYYEAYRLSLGQEFANEIFQTIQRIMDFPNAWQSLDKEARRCLTNRFPFGIIYFQREDEIVILAIMQLNKKPNYWTIRK